MRGAEEEKAESDNQARRQKRKRQPAEILRNLAMKDGPTGTKPNNKTKIIERKE
jgi:hypothetical protein